MSSLRNVVVEWLEFGVEPGQLDTLAVEDQRQFVGDVLQSSSEWTYDSFAEGFSRNPAKRAELEQAIRDGDFLQIGAVIDSVVRHYVIKTCADFWEAEFTMAEEENSDYQGDE